MAFLKRNTAAALKQAQQDLDVVQATIVELQRQRDALLLDGDVSEIERLQRDIENYSRQVQVFADRIAGLQPRLAQEQADQRKADRQRAIAAAEKILPQRMAAIEALAEWARDGVALVEKLEVSSKLKGWPAGLEKPYLQDIRTDQFLGAIARALSGLGGEWNPVHAVVIIADAVAIQIEKHREIIDQLRQSPAPQPEQSEIAA